jgi:hypothetical protein
LAGNPGDNPAIMTTTRHCAFVSATLGLCLSLGACDRSSLNKVNDAAMPDTRSKDAASPDEPSSPDLGGKDLPLSDLPGSDGSADVAVADAPIGPEAAPAKDGGPSDVAGDLLESDLLRAEVASDLAKTRLDAPVDGPGPCTPGGGSCNDNPIVSSIWGTCQADGTCLCKSGFELNPSTGRCRMPLADAADAMAACTGEFEACGCGCCSGVSPSVACYYPTLGESTATLREKDAISKAGADCTRAGCSAGVRYVCCTPVASPSTDTYTTSSYQGDMDHITISKSGGDCANLIMSRPSTTSADLRIDGPSRWGISALLGRCEAGAGTSPRGAVGTIVLRPSGESCLVDVHVTFFTFAKDGTLLPTGFDADGLLVNGVSAASCK